ncbi:MAG: glutathione S-transferase family protein [Geminicoccaceae bacterium]
MPVKRGLVAESVDIEPWKREDSFIALNHACEVPVLVDDDLTIVDGQAIADFWRRPIRRPRCWAEAWNSGRKSGVWWPGSTSSSAARSPTCCSASGYSATATVGTPNSEAMRAGAANIRGHMGYIAHLYEDRRWLGDNPGNVADLAAAAHLSVLDYLGDVPAGTFRRP